MLRTQTAKVVAAMLVLSAIARGATLSVGSLSMPPNSTVNVTVSGSVLAESTYGVTIQVELVPQAGATGTVTFSMAPPTDVVQAGDPWPGAGTFSAFDTDASGSTLLNGTVDDNGTFVPAAVTFSGSLSQFPVTASGTASGVWDVLLATSAGNSGWEGLTTTLVAGTITVTAGACLINSDCFDGDVCTNDVCTAGTCSNPNNTAICNDGDLCTTGDVCSGGTCAGAPVDCSAFSNTCNVGTCNPGNGQCQATPANNGGVCNDGDLCTANDLCSNGVCAGSPVDCSGLNDQCNIGTCNPGTGLCQPTPANKGGPCNDGNLCTISDICSAGACAGTPVDCSGLDSTCTVGVCNGTTGLCQANPTNPGGTCNDFNLCTTNDVCVSGTCMGTPVNCSPLNSSCTIGVCNGATGLCQANATNEGGICNDNNTCTSSDVCVSGVCLGTPIAGCEPCSTAAECNDGNPCTDDSCHPAGVCLHVNNTASCNDGLFCTAIDVCSAGACVGTGDPCTGGLLCDENTNACVECLLNADCDDANVCTNDACISGVCQYTNNTFSCDDGLFCTTSDICGGGTCVGSGSPCSGAQLCNETTDACVDCIVDADCEDGNVCTTDACVGGTCQVTNNTLPCNDGLFCTASDTCSGGVCVGTGFPCGVQFCSEKLGACVDCLTSANCNDGNFCTSDTCNVGACVFTNNTLPCDDGLFCTDTDVCSGGACAGSGDPCLGGLLCDETANACVDCLNNADCDDVNPCTDDICTLGVCSNPNNMLPCSDGLFCTLTDDCSGGVCVGSGDPCPGQLCNEITNACVDCLTNADCNDGNPCTDDICLVGACTTVNNSVSCNDGMFCTLLDTCSDGVCVGAGTPCPGQLCNESTDTCVDCLTNADCDDANLCTDDSCTGGLCSNTNNTVSCDDGLFCTATDACSGGACLGTGSPCTGGQFCNETLDSCVTCLIDTDCDDANLCTNDTCLAGGVCQNVNNTLVCNDNNICTISDRCTSGVCMGISLDCSSLSTGCLVGVCNPMNGLCEANPTNEGGSCDDGVSCTQNDICTVGVCAGSTVDCSGLVSFCRTASCNPTTGACDPTPINEGLACNDNDICTSADACTGGFCIGNLLPNCDSCLNSADCDDVNVCTSDFCHPVGVCFHGNLAGSCDDGNPCTSNDVCSVGICVGTPIPGCVNCTVPADCNDNSPCTNDLCVGGACQHSNVDGVACDDGNICTSTDACSGGACSGVPIPGCDQCVVNADCNDANVCTTDTCHPVGVCIYSNNTVSCNDGVACTQNDMCNNGTCAGSPTPNGGACDDGSNCTANDLCNGGVCAGVSANEGAACNDADLCSLTDVCVGGICQGTPLDCSALNNACNIGVCNPASGTCQPSSVNEGGACDDGVPCTVNDTCAAGSCFGSTADCSFLTTTCSIGTCNPTTGVCETTAANEGASCDDGSVCTTVDTCQSGLCTGPGPDCSFFNSVCTVGVCNAISGLCEAGPTNEGGDCDDGLICTISDQCVNGLCNGAPVDCSGVGNICALGICNPSTGLCETTPTNEGGACNDGALCTIGDVCVAGVCTGTPANCSGLTGGCLQGVCNATTGLCEQVPVPNGGACDDGDLCTSSDMCVGGVCSGVA
ncbi:MAG: hypothetical protein AABZ47_09530, partial [Planctomycetota bacterium]